MPRATHDLTDRHHGTYSAASVALSSLIDATLAAGITLEDAIRIIDSRLRMLEDGMVTFTKTLTADAVKA